MFIQTEITPNPQTIKFLPQLPAAEGKIKWQTTEWQNPAAAKDNPFATHLFAQTGVKRIFLGENFIAITKTEDFTWEQIKPDILSAIMDFFSTGGKIQSEKQQETKEESEITKKIKEIIATRIQPAVAQDGGDIQLDRFENGVAYLDMRGACAGCPSSTITLKNGVENLLRYYVPELVRVEANGLAVGEE
jgi:Fe-S cluster biogenesis protein NfuA